MSPSSIYDLHQKFSLSVKETECFQVYATCKNTKLICLSDDGN